jgi:hypothetical protein
MKMSPNLVGASQPRERVRPYAPLGVVLVISLVLRLGIYLWYAPVTYSDSRTYFRLAEQIRQGWANYDGSRTPGYPALLAVLGTDQNVWFVQLGMGVAITLLFYCLGWQLGVGLDAKKRQALAVAAGLAHTLNLGQLFFESNLLTETLATFYLTLVIAGWAVGYRLPLARIAWLAAGMGLCAALAILTRGLFIFVPFWTLLWIWRFWAAKPADPDPKNILQARERDKLSLFWKDSLYKLKKTFPALLAFTIPFTLVIGLWVGFIRYYYNQWGLEAMGGFHLIQNTGTFFEYVPDEYASIRDTYLKYRDEKIDQTGSQTNVIWKAIPEMMEASGLGFYDLSRTVGNISLDLIRTHPDLYLRNVAKGWWFFWRAPVYWSPAALQPQSLVPVVEGLVFGERVLLWGFNVLFLVTSLVGWWAPARRFMQLSPIHGYLAGTIWLTSVVQSFLDHGDNPRFLIPLQSLVVIWGIWVIYQIVQKFQLSAKVSLESK